MSNIFQPDQLKNSQEILNLLFWFVLNLCRYITSMQTMMRGMWARMSLRLEALQILSVNLLIRLSQPENFKTRILNFFKAKSLTTPYWIFKTCPITTEYWHHWKDIVKEKKKQHSPNDKNATKTSSVSLHTVMIRSPSLHLFRFQNLRMLADGVLDSRQIIKRVNIKETSNRPLL